MQEANVFSYVYMSICLFTRGGGAVRSFKTNCNLDRSHGIPPLPHGHVEPLPEGGHPTT